MSGRRNHFERAKNPMVLQERDKKIVTFCYKYHFLTQDQIRLLLDFGCQVRAGIRLRKLFDNGYLSRRFIPVYQGRAKILYFPGPKGVELISEQSGIDLLKIKQRRKQLLEIKNASLPHFLLINEFRLAFYLASKNKPEIVPKSWKTEKEIPLRLDEREFFPDFYLTYSYRNKVYSLFLEVDRSTETNKRIEEKVDNYLEYGIDGYYQKQFGFQFFKVLFVCQSQARLKNIRKLIERKTNKMFWLAVQDDITSEKILSRIWQRPHQESLVSLLET
ncbi:MAG: hypothetical protein CV087_05570 [Candidatus Brocadia sp. WS118]|nr:MAG: hypothetical protein CV087_05570 [Candidatus Brocadia sp. WS118]